jgi:hypothetical protein
MPADFDPGKFEHVEVNAKKKKKKKRSRCRLCGEQWWDIPSFILERMGFIPGWEVQQKYGKCVKLNDPENSVEAGTGLHSTPTESLSHGLTFHPPGKMTRDAGRSASGHWQGGRSACAAAHLPVLEVRDCQGLWSGTRDQGPAPGLAQAGASPWSLSHHRPGPGL